MKILLIEDEPLIQRTLKILFEKKGATVVTSGNGATAIQLILDSKYDKIVCDLMLQDITGFDIIEESKKVLSTKEISETFTIITAYSSPQIINKANQYGCEVFSKPFKDVNKVIDLIMRDKDEEQ